MAQKQTSKIKRGAARSSLRDVVRDEVERRKREDKRAAEIFLDLMAREDRQARLSNKICLTGAAVVAAVLLIIYAVSHHP